MGTDELPRAVVDSVERLARREHRAPSEIDRKRCRTAIDRALADYEFSWRIREDEDGETLVLYPSEWVDGVAQLDQIQDTSRAVERSLVPAATGDWAEVEAANREIVQAVRKRHGDVHAENAEALATFLENHHLCTIEAVPDELLSEFRTEYYPRNVWPSPQARACVEKSIELAVAVAEELSGVQ